MKKEKHYKVIRREDGRYEVRYVRPDGYLKTAVGSRIVLHELVNGHDETRMETKAEMVKRLCGCLGIEY